MNQAATVHALQQRIAQMQPLRMGYDVLPTAPQLRPLLPGGALRKGATTSVSGSVQLALALLAEASASGAWCGAIGLQHLGVEAVERLGIRLDRFVLAPDPGAHALGVTGMLSEVLSGVVLHSSSRPRSGEIERLNAKLREHGTSLVVLGAWPRNDVELRVVESHWSGVGRGHGMFEDQELVVRSLDRRGERRHTVRFSRGSLAPAREITATRAVSPAPEITLAPAQKAAAS